MNVFLWELVSLPVMAPSDVSTRCGSDLCSGGSFGASSAPVVVRRVSVRLDVRVAAPDVLCWEMPTCFACGLNKLSAPKWFRRVVVGWSRRIVLLLMMTCAELGVVDPDLLTLLVGDNSTHPRRRGLVVVDPDLLALLVGDNMTHPRRRVSLLF